MDRDFSSYAKYSSKIDYLQAFCLQVNGGVNEKHVTESELERN